MLKNLTLTTALLLFTTFLQAQGKYFTKTGNVAFYSTAPLEDIEAKTNTAAAILDTKTGLLRFSVLMKSFEFDKALMQEHFNEHYVESDKFPKAEFKGTVVNNSEINYSKPGVYTAKVKGTLTMHGVTKDVETNGTVKADTDNLKTTATFTVQLSEYGIKIPKLVNDKISNKVKIVIDCKLEPLKG